MGNLQTRIAGLMMIIVTFAEFEFGSNIE